MITSNSKLAIIILALAMLWGCSDSSTGPSADEAPEPPNFDRIEMDLGIFENAIPSKTDFPNDVEKLRSMLNTGDSSVLIQEQSPYEAAGFFAQFADILFQSYSVWPDMFFNEDTWGDPEVDGDTWIWEFSQSFEGESFSMIVTAETTSTNRIWELRYSVSGGDEPELDNALLLSANIALNGDSGEWAIYDLYEGDESAPLITFEFVIQDDLTTLLDMYEPDFDERLLYEVADQTATLTGFESGSAYTTIEWNRETGSGWIQSDDYNNGVQTCWDENFETTSC